MWKEAVVAYFDVLSHNLPGLVAFMLFSRAEMALKFPKVIKCRLL
jgi:hypothetical protein